MDIFAYSGSAGTFRESADASRSDWACESRDSTIKKAVGLGNITWQSKCSGNRENSPDLSDHYSDREAK